MKLTKLQRNTLLYARELRERPFPVWGAMLKKWKYYLIMVVLLGGYSYFAAKFGFSYIAGAALGVLVAIILRDIKYLIISSKMWPVNVEIMDWEKVDQLLEYQGDAESG